MYQIAMFHRAIRCVAYIDICGLEQFVSRVFSTWETVAVSSPASLVRPRSISCADSLLSSLSLIPMRSRPHQFVLNTSRDLGDLSELLAQV